MGTKPEISLEVTHHSLREMFYHGPLVCTVVELRDGGPCSTKDERNIDMLEIPEAEDNKKKLYKIYINLPSKGGPRRISILGWMWGEHSDKG